MIKVLIASVNKTVRNALLCVLQKISLKFDGETSLIVCTVKHSGAVPCLQLQLMNIDAQCLLFVLL